MVRNPNWRERRTGNESYQKKIHPKGEPFGPVTRTQKERGTSISSASKQDERQENKFPTLVAEKQRWGEENLGDLRG